MPTNTIGNFLYLGRFADTDPDETDGVLTENAADLLGVYNDLSLVEVTAVDNNSDTIIRDDEANDSSGDSLIYDVGYGEQNVENDSTVQYAAQVTLADGSTITGNFFVIQTTSGDVFLMADIALDNVAIAAVELLEVRSAVRTHFATGQSIDNSQVVCFLAGTRVDTPIGHRRVEDLRPGDIVNTLRDGPMPLIWVGSMQVAATDTTKPIRFEPDALGRNIPASTLLVSPQHRVLGCNKAAKRMNGSHFFSPRPSSCFLWMAFPWQVAKRRSGITTCYFPDMSPYALRARGVKRFTMEM